MRPDPVGLLGGMNLFLYSLNNPGTLFDPFGLQQWNLISATESFHAGYQVNLPWRDIGRQSRQLGQSAYAIASGVCKAVKRECEKPVAERAMDAQAGALYLAAAGGLHTMDSSLATAYVMLGTAEIVVWAPELVVVPLMYPQHTVDFVTSLSPGCTPAMSSWGGPAGYAVGSTLGIK